jgi:hypothetical protein
MEEQEAKDRPRQSPGVLGCKKGRNSIYRYQKGGAIYPKAALEKNS